MPLSFHDESARTRRICLALVIAGVLVRLPGLFHNFTPTEIEAVRMANALDGLGALFTGLHTPANHWLQTLLTSWLGDPVYWGIHRVLPLAAGVALLFVVGFRLTYESETERRITCGLFAGAYVLVDATAQAHGTAYALLFALLAYRTAGACIVRTTPLRAAQFGIAVVLGLLSHPAFMALYVAVLVWSVAAVFGRRTFMREAFVDALRCHAVPLLCAVALYAADMRHYPTAPSDATGGGGLVSAVGWLLGAPLHGAGGTVAAVALGAMLLLATWYTQQEQRSDWLLGLVAVFAAPPLTGWLLRDGQAAWSLPHVVLVTPFILLLLARFLALCFQVGRLGHVVCAIVLGLYAAGNGLRLTESIAYGHGAYRAALRAIVTEEGSQQATLGSDDDAGNAALVQFHRRRVAGGTALRYTPRDAWPPAGPDWFLRHADDPHQEPEPVLAIPRADRQYVLQGTYRHAPPTGRTWHLYRNEPVGAAAR